MHGGEILDFFFVLRVVFNSRAVFDDLCSYYSGHSATKLRVLFWVRVGGNATRGFARHRHTHTHTTITTRPAQTDAQTHHHIITRHSITHFWDSERARGRVEEK